MIDTKFQTKPLNPVVTALQKALDACWCASVQAVDSQIGTFSYSGEFSILWELDTQQSIRAFSDGDFVIVVDDGWNRSSDLPEANKHLTALDWAVWLSLSRWKTGKDGQLHMPTVILLTNNAPPTSSSSSDAERFWSMFAGQGIPALPWIKMVPLIGRNEESCCLVQLLELIASSKGGKQPRPRGDLSMIRQVWQSFFLRPTLPSDNHALANLLGAGLLTGDFGNSPTRQALMKLMQTLELLPGTETIQTPRICPNAISKAASDLYDKLPKKARSKLRLMLVDDDQERHGWADFLASSLGLRLSSMGENLWAGQIGKMPTEFSATDSAAELLASVKASQKNPGGLRFDLDHHADILFLDLRLFERASLPIEATFFIDVINELRAINNLHEADPRDWPRVHEDELQRLEDWCKIATDGSGTATRNDGQYIDSLTLLPRLAAIVDADLPIILFSSTQRRRVTELLRPYGNVITAFSKPTLQLGSSEQMAEETSASFERAVLAAVEIVHARRLRRSLLSEDFPVYWKGHVEKPIEEKADEPWSVQLLIDESGEKKLTVGGFLAVYPPGISPHTVNDEIYRKYPMIREQTKEERRQNLPATLWEVIGILEEFGVLVVPISISGKQISTVTAHSGWKGSSFFQDEMVEDNLHRELMRCLIELGLYVFVRQILPESASVEFHFHAPTRQLPVKRPEAGTLDNVWGIQSANGFAKHFDHNCARSLVEEVSREYRRSTFEPQPVLARAYGLNTRRAEEVTLVRALHYLADCWVSDKKHPDLLPLRELSIKGSYGPNLSRLLEAHRHLVNGEIARSIAIGALVAIEVSPTERSTATNSVVVALQDAARSMTGPECLALAAALRQMEPKAANLRVVGIVRSVSKKDSSVQIEWGSKLFLAVKEELRESVSIGDWVQFVPRRGNRVGSFVARNVQTIKNENEPHEIDSI